MSDLPAEFIAALESLNQTEAVMAWFAKAEAETLSRIAGAQNYETRSAEAVILLKLVYVCQPGCRLQWASRAIRDRQRQMMSACA